MSGQDSRLRGRWGEDADHLVTTGPYTLESVDGERAVTAEITCALER